MAGHDAVMEFRILGPFEVSENGESIELGGGKQRALLALLLLNAGKVVSTDRLIDGLWGERPPASATNSVHIYVSQLRKVLGDSRLQTRGHGYLLALEPDQLDLLRFERLLGEGRAFLAAGDAERAGATLLEGLALWRGPPLSDFASEPFAQSEIARFEELHLAALEERIEADLALGRHADLVAELEALVREHPLRERLRAQLMLALYRSGRQAEALATYQQARRMLAEELGLEPSRKLQELERAILTQDTVLDPPVQAVPRARVARRSGILIAVGSALLLFAAVAVAVIELTGTDNPGLTSVSANSVAAIDGSSNRVVAEIPVGNGPSSLAYGEGSLWVTNADGDNVSRVDPVKQDVIQTIAVGSGPRGITTGNGAVWVANSLERSVSRIDPATNTVVQTIPVGNGPAGIVHGAGSIWVANTGDDTITRIDARTGKPTTTLQIAASELAFGDGTLWVSQRTANRVARVDPSSERVVHTIAVGNGPAGLAFGRGAAWVANSLDGTVSRIDPRTNSVRAAVSTGNGTRGVAVDANAVWASNEFEGTLVRIEPRTNEVDRRIRVGNRPQGIATANGNVLVSVRESGAGHRGGTLRVRMNRPAEPLDTALAWDTNSWPILRMTGDGLVAFNQVGGLAGTQLVPDLALSLPFPTDGGRTYTFRLRPNIRYDDGSVVKASDFRSTFERHFTFGFPVTSYYGAIDGTTRCQKTGKRCDLSEGIVADDDAGTVTFHLTAPDPEFLQKLALPFAYVVPEGTPVDEAGTLPATGPYTIETYDPQRVIRLTRNPQFREWSQAAQPDGYPDEIVFKVGGTPDKAANDVIRGKADVFSSSQSQTPPSANVIEMMTTRHASQVHFNAQPNTIALFLNTRVAPFDRIDVRKALNFAADRAAAVRAVGGPDLAQATCQILPRHFPGYRPYCPYTAGPTSQGAWTAPDLARARALVAASGTRGMKITVWSWGKLAGVGPFTVKLLQSLGYRTSLKEISDAGKYFSTIGDSRKKAQIGTVEWISDYPAASGFFNVVLTCASFVPNTPGNLNSAQFCDPSIDRQIERARTGQVTNPDAARGVWERVDRQTVDQAPWLPLVNPKVVDVLSKRVGNYQYSARGLGMLIDQLWVR